MDIVSATVSVADTTKITQKMTEIKTLSLAAIFCGNKQSPRCHCGRHLFVENIIIQFSLTPIFFSIIKWMREPQSRHGQYAYY